MRGSGKGAVAVTDPTYMKRREGIISQVQENEAYATQPYSTQQNYDNNKQSRVAEWLKIPVW